MDVKAIERARRCNEDAEASDVGELSDAYRRALRYPVTCNCTRRAMKSHKSEPLISRRISLTPQPSPGEGGGSSLAASLSPEISATAPVSLRVSIADSGKH